MGLDMFLYAKRYISPFNKEDEKYRASLGELFDGLDIGEVSARVAYWRKANAIHRWFVQECGGGVDNCKPCPVEGHQLYALLDLCKRVLEDRDKAPDLLPSQSGFFFGGTEYDQYYFADIELTIEQLEKALKLSNAWDFEYCASW